MPQTTEAQKDRGNTEQVSIRRTKRDFMETVAIASQSLRRRGVYTITWKDRGGQIYAMPSKS